MAVSEVEARSVIVAPASLPRTSRPLASTVLPRMLERKKPPAREAIKYLISFIDLVAGVGFEPTTFRL